MDDVGSEHLQQLLRVLRETDGWLTLIDPGRAQARPAVRSPMSRDDELAYPYLVSHGAWSSLSHAVDHLHCLRTLLADAKIIHMYAPYSLTRGALENACSAVWVLQPTSRHERVMRRLRIAVSDIQHGEKAWELTGAERQRSESERLTEVADIAKRADLTEKVKGVNYTEIVRDVGEPPNPMATAFSWRLCSGFAHGDLWPTLSAAERVELPGALPGMASFAISADLQMLLRVTMVAVILVKRGWALYDQRCTPPY
jgi:hypothetical protein